MTGVGARLLVLVGIVLGPGCAQLLGLDATSQGGVDADPNAVCAAAPACPSSGAGTSVCGQLVDAGTGAPLRVARPTGLACTGTEGPCALAVRGVDADALFAAMSPTPVVGSIDDCGRYQVADVAGARVGLEVSDTGSTYRRVLHLMPASTSAMTEPLELVTTASTATWLPGQNLARDTGYLVAFTSAGAAASGVTALIDGTPPASNLTPPYAWYFDAPTPYQGLSLASPLAASGVTGTALVAPASAAPFVLGGARGATTCGAVNGLAVVPQTLVFVTLSGC